MSMKHIQVLFEGTSVDAWEKDHKIKRKIIGDCEYVTCQDFQGFMLQCEAEEAFAFKAMVAEQQAEASGLK